jgi:hypothetical protein
MTPRITPAGTPDGRYLVVRGRLWRRADPRIDPDRLSELTHALMAARRSKGQAMRAGDQPAREQARAEIDRIKIALGERGPVWWSDGAPDLGRHLVRNTPYADWFSSLTA